MNVDRSALPVPTPKSLVQAYVLATHQLDSPRVFTDPISARIVNVRGDLLPGPPSGGDVEHQPDMRLHVALCHRYADDITAAATVSGTTQLVILDAGLDTTCYRRLYPATSLFEFDLPQTQTWKRQRLADVGISTPPTLRYIPFDHDHDFPSLELARAGYDFHRPTLVVWLDSTVFLTVETITNTLGWIDHHQGPLEIVFDYLQHPRTTPAETLETITPLRTLMTRAGQPLISFLDPSTVADNLRSHRFDRIDNLSWSDLLARYLPDHANTPDPLGGRILHATRPAA